MNEVANSQNVHLERVLGEYDQNVSGPTVVFTCGIHGNEPSGVKAFSNVLDRLEEVKPAISGRLIGLSGNITALVEGERFIDEDLNRIWTQERINRLNDDTHVHELSVEELEQKYMWDRLSKIFKMTNGPIYVIDLHTTSSESQPFLSINDTLRNRHFAMKFPLPAILGIEEHLEGTILNYMNQLGQIAVGVEAGSHEDPASVKNHEAAIWLALFYAGAISPASIPNSHLFYEQLAKGTMNDKKVFEVRHRFKLAVDTAFIMNPGYTNFQKIHKNEFLAVHNYEEVRAKESGRIFMPLYQKLGNDGFFIIREIRLFWLKVSEYLRRLKLEKALPYLPGVSRHKGLDHELIINLRIARWYVIEFFHLLGFRRKEKKGKKLILIKRKYDVQGPELMQLMI
ncbi:succinylglutamate desuccinylase/aspartoacylase family protein [Reichenbachiella sp.]|uniref:succinylglutamate desuccinylase/aspartoacylase domain-containing protein n=1 Tax=Reichenbachiella sp. TaxID=2184521 RepID=UPI003298E48B